VFSDVRHLEAFVFFMDRARDKKQSSTAKGLLLGVFFSTEGPQDEDILDKEMLMILFPAKSPQDKDVI
jgi:hypothetical protein